MINKNHDAITIPFNSKPKPSRRSQSQLRVRSRVPPEPKGTERTLSVPTFFCIPQRGRQALKNYDAAWGGPIGIFGGTSETDWLRNDTSPSFMIYHPAARSLSESH